GGAVRARVCQCLRHGSCLSGSCSGSSRVLQPPVRLASMNPAAPDRSLFNWVVPESSQAVLDNYEVLARTYAEAGVRAWTVWSDAEDSRLGEALERRGHELDAKPMAMGADLAELTLPAVADLSRREADDARLVSAINDAAYGFPSPAFAAAFTRIGQPRWYGYVASLHGRPVATVLTHESSEGDCGVNAVATLPEARGHAIASRLLAVALRRALNRGARSTTLQATSKGRPIYERLGYRSLGPRARWEHRVSP